MTSTKLVFFLSISKEGNNNSCDKESRSFNLSPERAIFFPFPVPKRSKFWNVF